MYKYLRKAIEKEAAEQMKKDCGLIRCGYDNNRDAILLHYLTEKEAAKYQAKQITRAEAIKKATNRRTRQIEKNTAADLAKLDAAENSTAPKYIKICVEFSKNWNAFAEVRTDCEYATGSACGFGYDKESSAISEAFGKIPAIMRILYDAEEERLKGIKTRKQTRHDVIGYGSGYGALPYFEGGTGIECFAHILEKCGYKYTQISGRHINTFLFEKL